jgi:hypothetical protein
MQSLLLRKSYRKRSKNNTFFTINEGRMPTSLDVG